MSIADFRVEPDPRGHRVRIRWSWTGPTDRLPPLVLVRRRGHPPLHVDDGITVANLVDLGRLRRAAEPRPARRVEALAEVAFEVADAAPADEAPADMAPADMAPADEAPADMAPADMAPADEAPADEAPADRAPADEAPADEAPELRLVVQRFVADNAPVDGGLELASRSDVLGVDEPLPLLARPAALDPVAAAQIKVTVGETPSSRSWPWSFTTTAGAQGGPRLHGGRIVRVLPTPATEPGFRFDIEDLPDALSTHHDYALFVVDADRHEAPRGEVVEHLAVPVRAVVRGIVRGFEGLESVVERGAPEPAAVSGTSLATDTYGTDGQLFGALPSVLQRHDTSTRPTAPDEPEGGLLERLIRTLATTLDEARSTAASLQSRHDLGGAPAPMLPALANLVGWDLDRTLHVATQRGELRQAMGTWATLGTPSLTASLVSRLTGWACRAAETHHNVFRTNAPEHLRRWHLWRATLGSMDRAHPVAGQGGSIDGGPALPAAAETLVVWHSDRPGPSPSGFRRIWRAVPGQAAAPAEGLDPGAFHDEDPAVVIDADGRPHLFWSSDRGGAWNLWMRTLGGDRSAAQITFHEAADRTPTVVLGQQTVWLFWASNRTGRWGIWTRSGTLGPEGIEWTASRPLFVGDADFRHPHALLQPGTHQLWLLFQEDTPGRSRVVLARQTGGIWTAEPDRVSPVSPDADRTASAPTAAWSGDVLHVFWHSRRGTGSERTRIWGRTVAADRTLGPAAPVVDRPLSAREPAAHAAPDGALTLYWRSQEAALTRLSTTVDFDALEVNAHRAIALQAAADGHPRPHEIAHFTYDFRDERPFSGGAVVLHVDRGHEDAPTDEDERLRKRTLAWLEGFRPIDVRFIWRWSSLAPEPEPEPPPLPVENLLADTEELAGSSWQPYQLVVTSDLALAPADPSRSGADRLLASAQPGAHLLGQTVNAGPGRYLLSAHVKPDGIARIRLELSAPRQGPFQDIDITRASHDAAKGAIALADGWVRAWALLVVDAGQAFAQARIGLFDPPGDDLAFEGGDRRSVLVWGAQLETLREDQHEPAPYTPGRRTPDRINLVRDRFTDRLDEGGLVMTDAWTDEELP